MKRLILLVAVLMAVPAFAQRMTTTKLRDNCAAWQRVLDRRAAGNDSHDADACVTYVLGVLDGLQAGGASVLKPVTAEQAIVVFMRGGTHPENLSASAARALGLALQAAEYIDLPSPVATFDKEGFQQSEGRGKPDNH